MSKKSLAIRKKPELEEEDYTEEVSKEELKPQILDKLKTKRFLYLVDKNTFIPHEKGGNQKFFSQSPVIILQKEKIKSVYDHIIPPK